VWPLHYTGHPIFDVGLAAITAYSRKPDPGKLTETDLEDVASFIERYYTPEMAATDAHQLISLPSNCGMGYKGGREVHVCLHLPLFKTCFDTFQSIWRKIRMNSNRDVLSCFLASVAPRCYTGCNIV